MTVGVRSYDGRCAQLRGSVCTVGCFTDGRGRASGTFRLDQRRSCRLVGASAITLVGLGCGDERRAYAVWGRFEGEHVGKSVGLLVRVITAHLKKDAAVSWQGLDFDLTGAAFDCGDFMCARFSSGRVSFTDARFSGGEVYFDEAEFSCGQVDFRGADFTGGTVDFSNPRDWSVPPAFPWTDTPPIGVKLPETEHQTKVQQPRGGDE
jgi:hypothetical protein